ncbi:hypothetical protein [Actinomyces ruminis]|uniref:Uncharacterized protein n=1 Tax=Actinomyces ruminis TaxID=1937003 RepID=A0ABX4M995_9ACTO|nr:hypothetical protein [Actinomyces ruminis]PHP52033.1 hypothetical protein BW737_012435 [Actinomyces ruminis]
MRALSLAGWKVFHAQWDLSDLDAAERRAAVAEATDRLAECTANADERLVLAKSLDTMASGWAADNAVPAVWLTPLLYDDECLNDISRFEAPAVPISGSRDWAWDDAAAKLSGKQRLCLGACDHALLPVTGGRN